MRKSAKLALYGVVLAGVVAGTAAWATTDKAIAVSIDGQTRTIHTRAATVGGALNSAKVPLAAHDAVAPDVSSKIADKGTIVIRKGRLLHLNVDGKAVDVWTTATTVDEALDALGYGTGKTVSVSRSTRLPLTATDITLLTPKTVTVKVDGTIRTVVTTDRVVSQVLSDLHVSLGAYDTVSAAPATPVVSGQVLIVKRVRYATVTSSEPVPYTTTSTKDATIVVGTTEVVTAGKNGANTLAYRIVYVDGKLTGAKLMSRTVAVAAVPQVEKVGTKPVTPPAGTGSTGTGSTGTGTTTAPTVSGTPRAIGAALVAARGWGPGEFSCLDKLFTRESGWNPSASNAGSGAYGIPQALPGSKMATVGADWQTNPATQITWGLNYIAGRYGTPCGAWAHSEANNWY